MDDGKPFTAKDAKELAGVSYRQLNDWEARGAVDAERDRVGAWRKFTPKQIFALMICNEIRKQYGIPVEKLQFIKSFMMQEGQNHLSAAIRLMQHGLHVFLLTDLEEKFVMDSDLEFTEYMQSGHFRIEETRPYIFLRLNEVVNRLLGALKKPVQLEPHDDAYRVKAQVDVATTVRTVPELEVLQAIRSGKFDRVEVTIKDGLIRLLDADGDNAAGCRVPSRGRARDLEVESDAVKVVSMSEFKRLARNARSVRTKRTLPRKYSVKDNEPVLFAGRLPAKPRS